MVRNHECHADGNVWRDVEIKFQKNIWPCEITGIVYKIMGGVMEKSTFKRASGPMDSQVTCS